jgi:hypothetical protein
VNSGECVYEMRAVRKSFELVDPLEPADNQLLQVELVRDPEIEVGVELVRLVTNGSAKPREPVR